MSNRYFTGNLVSITFFFFNFIKLPNEHLLLYKVWLQNEVKNLPTMVIFEIQLTRRYQELVVGEWTSIYNIKITYIQLWPKVLRQRQVLVFTLLRNGSRQVWVHLHAQRGKGFWRMAWCQEGQQWSHFSPGKTSGTEWYSAKGTGIGLLKTGVQSFSLMNSLSNCLEHPKRKVCLEKRWVLPLVLYHAKSKAFWDHACVVLLLSQGSGLTHNYA